MPRKPKQLMLDVRMYSVRADGYEAEIQAGTPAAAKFELYRRLREAGYFKESGFRAFLERMPVAWELRR